MPVNANGWKTNSTFLRPAKSARATRSSRFTTRSKSGACCPFSIAIACLLLAGTLRAIVTSPLQLVREVVDLEPGGVVVRVDVPGPVAELLGAGVVGVAQRLRRPEVAALAHVANRLAQSHG